jgi:hypothetical protein
MFLRIDKVCGSTTAPPTPSNDTLHACLATSVAAIAAPDVGEEGGGPNVIPDDSVNATGELFVVGRKNAVVTIDDKVRLFALYYTCVVICHLSVHFNNVKLILTK